MIDSTYILSSGAVISKERNLRQDHQVKGSGLLTNSVHETDKFGMILLVGDMQQVPTGAIMMRYLL